jgi:hypothetical protein
LAAPEMKKARAIALAARISCPTSSRPFDRKSETLLEFRGSFRLHGKWSYRGYPAPAAAVEVLVKRKESVRLQLAERPPELLLNTIDFVEESSPIDTDFSAAQLPIGAKQKMVLEQAVLIVIEISTADQAEICDKLLVLQAPH